MICARAVRFGERRRELERLRTAGVSALRHRLADEYSALAARSSRHLPRPALSIVGPRRDSRGSDRAAASAGDQQGEVEADMAAARGQVAACRKGPATQSTPGSAASGVRRASRKACRRRACEREGEGEQVTQHMFNTCSSGVAVLLEQTGNPSVFSLQTPLRGTTNVEGSIPRSVPQPSPQNEVRLGQGDATLRAREQALLAELGPNWRAPLPENPSPAEELAAWCLDAERVHEVAERLRLKEWHRRELARLEAAS